MRRTLCYGALAVAILLGSAVACHAADPPLDLRDTPEGAATLARFIGPGAVEVFGRGTVRAYAPPAWRRDAQRAWRAAERAVPDVALAVGVQPAQLTPIWIVIASSERAYTREAPSWSAAIAQPERHLVVVSGPVLHRSAMDAEETVVHEIVHLAVHARLDDIGWMPRWLEEGLAMHFSGYSRVSDPLAANGRGAVRLRDLNDAFPQHPTLAREAYLESEAAVRELLARGSLRPLLDRLAAGEEFEDAFAAVYGESVEHFEAHIAGEVPRPWRWLGTLGNGATFGLVTAALVIAGALRVRWRNRRRLRAWEEQERAARLAVATSPEPEPPPQDPAPGI
jgi:hypothetical protein